MTGGGGDGVLHPQVAKAEGCGRPGARRREPALAGPARPATGSCGLGPRAPGWTQAGRGPPLGLPLPNSDQFTLTMISFPRTEDLSRVKMRWVLSPQEAAARWWRTRRGPAHIPAYPSPGSAAPRAGKGLRGPTCGGVQQLRV